VTLFIGVLSRPHRTSVAYCYRRSNVVCLCAVVKVDRRIRWHYTTTILRLRIGVYDSRGIEIVNFTTAAALSAGTLMASAGTPYRLVPAHFYPCLCVLPFSVDHDREPCKTDEPIERLFEVGADSQGLKRGPPAFNWL